MKHIESGMTLVEILLAVSAMALFLVTATTYSVPWIARENMRGAVYDIQTYLQLARIEAVSRNRECRMVLDAGARTLEIYDTVGTPSTSDDERLYRRSMPSSVSFARPDSGDAVSFEQIGGGRSYQVRFASDGTVTAGIGAACLFGGEQYGRISVFGAGGTQVERWNGRSWQVGS